MAQYHSEPNRAAPASHTFFSVSTPSVFREHKLPACNADWTRADQRKYRELEQLAEAHGAHIQRTSYRRG